MADYETTLNKFRGLVAQLQEANKELRSKQLESETKAETPTIELFDFKAKFAETKAFAKVRVAPLFTKKKKRQHNNFAWQRSNLPHYHFILMMS
jgi:hypothetical protein